MKIKIIKLSLLFLTMSVLTSSRIETGINKTGACLKEESACLQTKNTTCPQALAIPDNDAGAASVSDTEIPLSPISRFILLQ